MDQLSGGKAIRQRGRSKGPKAGVGKLTQEHGGLFRGVGRGQGDRGSHPVDGKSDTRSSWATVRTQASIIS